MALEVTPVREASGLDAFVALSYALHRQDRNWTPPLRRDVRALLAKGKNPLLPPRGRRAPPGPAQRARGRARHAIHNRLHEEGLAETARWYAEAGWL
ncbi:MAG: hypothetical protein DMF78_05340 [Acidobacteria bacterium]|nr:MAG: hypothetical protein DMF78_05340 [Acidobacteriota bacterium]